MPSDTFARAPLGIGALATVWRQLFRILMSGVCLEGIERLGHLG